MLKAAKTVAAKLAAKLSSDPSPRGFTVEDYRKVLTEARGSIRLMNGTDHSVVVGHIEQILSAPPIFLVAAPPHQTHLAPASFACYWHDQHDGLYIIGDDFKAEVPQCAKAQYEHPPRKHLPLERHAPVRQSASLAPDKAQGSPHITTDMNPSTGHNTSHSMHRHAFGADRVQHDSQSDRHFFTKQRHGETLDAVGEACLDDDHGPAIVGLLNGAIDWIGGDHMTLRDNARDQQSPSRREPGDTSHVAQTSKKDSPASQKQTLALSEWSGWDESTLPWSRAKHQDAVCRAVFGPTWSMEDAAALIGFINCTWDPSPSPHVHLSCPERSRAVPENQHRTYDNAQTPSPHVDAPQGWKLVPIEPTDAMLELPENFYAGANRQQRGLIYKTMLNRAPPAPQTTEKGAP